MTRLVTGMFILGWLVVCLPFGLALGVLYALWWHFTSRQTKFQPPAPPYRQSPRGYYDHD